MLEVIPENAIRIRRTTGGKLVHSRNLDIKIDDHVVRAEHLNATHLPRCSASFERPSPHLYMLLDNCRLPTHYAAYGIDQLGFRPIVFAVGYSVCAIP